MATAGASAVTGKSMTVTYGGTEASCQVTSLGIDESAEAETIQTLGCSATISKGVESSISMDLLYDGGQANSVYGVLKAALGAGTAAEVEITAASGETWTGQAVVTSLGVEVPADGAVACSAEMSVSGSLAWTAAAAPGGGA